MTITNLEAGLLSNISVEIAAEVLSARIKHGKQEDVPFGTGPDRSWYIPRAMIGDGPNEWLPTFETLSGWARKRTDTAMANGTLTREMIVTEEIFEAFAESDPQLLRAELIQSAAMLVAWVARIDEGQVW